MFRSQGSYILVKVRILARFA